MIRLIAGFALLFAGLSCQLPLFEQDATANSYGGTPFRAGHSAGSTAFSYPYTVTEVATVVKPEPEQEKIFQETEAPAAIAEAAPVEHSILAEPQVASCPECVHTQPVYSQPVYSQPVYSQPVYMQTACNSHSHHGAPRGFMGRGPVRRIISAPFRLFHRVRAARGTAWAC